MYDYIMNDEQRKAKIARCYKKIEAMYWNGSDEYEIARSCGISVTDALETMQKIFALREITKEKEAAKARRATY